MSAENAIHATWEGDVTLTTLIPIAKFVTGWQEPEDEYTPTPDLLPFATLTRVDEIETENTSSNTELATVQYRFDVWTDNLADTKAAAKRIRTLYRKYDAQWSNGQKLDKVLNMTARQPTEERQTNGIWHAAIEFDALTETNY